MSKQGFTSAHFAAAVSALLVSYGSSAVIIYQAAQSFGAAPDQITSWFTALAAASGVLTLWASLRYRVPVMYAWCTPGAALMVGMSGISMGQAVAAFMVSAAVMWLVSVSGWFDKLVKLIPPSLASAMLAGVLLNFGAGVFKAMEHQLLLVLLMLAVYLLSKIRLPRHSILLMLLTGLAAAGAMGLVDTAKLAWTPPAWVWMPPEWDWGAVISVGVPLFIASLATQNVPGMAVMHAYGFRPPAKPLINAGAAATVAGAPFGVFTVNLAAISAAICMGGDVDKDPQQRYCATLLLGGLYLLMALLGGMKVSLFTALPGALLAALAGIAIFGTLQANLVAAWQDEASREASLVTLLASASGMTLFGVGSAFWGLVLGVAVYRLNKKTAVR